jgi:hypothetical protein
MQRNKYQIFSGINKENIPMGLGKPGFSGKRQGVVPLRCCVRRPKKTEQIKTSGVWEIRHFKGVCLVTMTSSEQIF